MLGGEFMIGVSVPCRSEILWWTKYDSCEALLPVERKDRREIFDDISTSQQHHFDM
jgi:hypothetical protein